MGVIADVYDDLDTDVSLEEFREAVEDKVEQMGGLADEETAAMLIAHELKDEEVNGIADIEPGMEEVKFQAKIVSIGELRTFERDGEDQEDGYVVNMEVADSTGRIRISLWDGQAISAVGDPEASSTANWRSATCSKSPVGPKTASTASRSALIRPNRTLTPRSMSR